MHQYTGAVIAEKNILTPLCIVIQTSPINLAVASETEICFLLKNCIFKWHIVIDRHSLRLKPNHSHLSDPPHFLLISKASKKI
jgi:hypothetical protein